MNSITLLTRTVPCLLLLLSLLPASLPQQESCNPYDRPNTCNVTSCLTCTTSTSATCTRTSLSPDFDTINCSAPNITGCEFKPCEDEPGHVTVCVSSFNEPDGRANFHASCFPLAHQQFGESCDPSTDCIYERAPDRLTCCCYENDCIRDSLSLNVSIAVTGDMDNTTAVTSDPSTPGPGGFDTLPVAIGIIAAALFLLIIAGLIALLYCCRHNLWKLNCLRFFKRRRTRQTGIERRFSGRAPQPWVLQGMVGQGRFGQVYKALYNGDIVAVKMYSHHHRTTWENERNLFALDSTRHENIVQFIMSSAESGELINTSQQQLYLVTSYYPLGSLEGYLRRVVLTWTQACVMVRSIASGLRHLHSDSGVNEDGISCEKYPIAHRDIKSSNILVKSESGECVIGDLGLALQLIPSDNPSNYGQVGTVRYMSPEALEARVNLMDMQSFKQIDIYAFSLVMWEIMSRCCVLTADEVGGYQLPFADLVRHPTLEVMKDIVCSRQLRPSIPALWSNHEPLTVYAQMMTECWDSDPESRLTAANIHYQMEDLCNMSTQSLKDQHSHTPSSTSHTPSQQQPHPPDVQSLLFHREHSQSSPPPCYSPTDPVPFSAMQNQDCRRGMRPGGRGYFQTSMPHILQGEREEGRREAYNMISLTPRCTRSLRSSGINPPSGWGQYRSPGPHSTSVRNSLVLQIHDDPLPTFSDACMEDAYSSSSQSIPELGVALDCLDRQVVRQSGAGQGQSTASSIMDLHIPNADSGIQVVSSNASQSTIQSSQSSHTLATPTDTPTTAELMTLK